MAESSSFGTICAVIVTYNIGNAFDSCFNSTRGQVDHVVIVNTSTDNGDTARTIERIRESNRDFVDLITCQQNNLAMAQNMGISLALEKGYDWVLLLDHDSRMSAGMISAMEGAWRKTPNRLKVGLIAPYLDDPAIRRPPQYLQAWQRFWFRQAEFDPDTPVIDGVLCVPASGSLIPRRVFETEHPLDEGFVIDFIDTDFCLGLVTRGMRIIAVRDAKMNHKFGLRQSHRVLGIDITATHHAPIRRYYMTRNRIHVWRRYAAKVPGFFLFDLLRMVYEIWRILLVESDKTEKLQNFAHGLWDGLRGKTGPKPA